jgi:hypothetical protein
MSTKADGSQAAQDSSVYIASKLGMADIANNATISDFERADQIVTRVNEDFQKAISAIGIFANAHPRVRESMSEFLDRVTLMTDLMNTFDQRYMRAKP